MCFVVIVECVSLAVAPTSLVVIGNVMLNGLVGSIHLGVSNRFMMAMGLVAENVQDRKRHVRVQHLVRDTKERSAITHRNTKISCSGR